MIPTGASGSSAPMRDRVRDLITGVQDEICAALEAADGGRFSPETWTRPEGGGGTSRVLAEGRVLEKAGVNVSTVWGPLPEGAAAAMRASRPLPAGALEFFATGVSVVIHPANPNAPTAHCNFRYFEVHGETAIWWFGGGADLTPAILFEADAEHFHRTFKRACDAHDPAFYPRFKRWCDEYFYLPHRGEARGVGGIFFDDLADRGADVLLAFVAEVAHAFVPAYLPILERRAAMPFTPAERDWQLARRGRYAEFNLVYDRGTAFGLRTGGRPESVLMSLPPLVRWPVEREPTAGSPEARLLDVLRHPRDWA